MKFNNISFAPILLLIFIAFSCVPAQKFKETDQKLQNCNTELDLTKQKQEELSVENAEMKQQLSKYENQLNSLIKDSMTRTTELEKLKIDYDRVNGQFNELQESQETILKGNQRETAKLMTQLQTTQEDLKKKESALQQTEKQIDEKKQNLENMKFELEKRDARINEIEKILFKKDSDVTALKSKISGALKGFDKEDLTVKTQNGKVYVSLQEQLLFKSGSTEVDKKGVDALQKLARVLEQNPDINITIEGHTDNVPYKAGSDIKDNWDLSVQRATSIIRILQNNSKIDPKRFTAAGRGEYWPLVPNKNAESKAKNRRTEIILTPKLDEIFKVLGNN